MEFIPAWNCPDWDRSGRRPLLRVHSSMGLDRCSLEGSPTIQSPLRSRYTDRKRSLRPRALFRIDDPAVSDSAVFEQEPATLGVRISRFSSLKDLRIPIFNPLSEAAFTVSVRKPIYRGQDRRPLDDPCLQRAFPGCPALSVRSGSSISLAPERPPAIISIPSTTRKAPKIFLTNDRSPFYPPRAVRQKVAVRDAD